MSRDDEVRQAYMHGHEDGFRTGRFAGYNGAFVDIYASIPELPSELWIKILGVRRQKLEHLEKEGEE